MFGIETLGSTLQSVVLVGLVLVEALALYVGYGTLEELVGKRFITALTGE